MKFSYTYYRTKALFLLLVLSCSFECPGQPMTSGDEEKLKKAFNYRYVTQSSFPGPFRDAARAIQYVRYHANELGIDPTRIATTGGSAGTNLSVWFATHDDLTCPNNPDPILRESTRLTTIIVRNAQTSNDPFFWMENIYNGDGVHSSIYDFYGVNDMNFDELKDVMSEKKYRAFDINEYMLRFTIPQTEMHANSNLVQNQEILNLVS